MCAYVDMYLPQLRCSTRVKFYKLKKSVIYRVSGQDSSSFKFLTEELKTVLDEKTVLVEQWFPTFLTSSSQYFLYTTTLQQSPLAYFSLELFIFVTMECIRSYVLDTKEQSMYLSQKQNFVKEIKLEQHINTDKKHNKYPRHH